MGLKKKIIIIVASVLAALLAGVGIALPFVLKGSPELKVTDIFLTSGNNEFTYGGGLEKILQEQLTVTYEDGSSIQIKLSETTISSVDLEKLNNAGNYVGDNCITVKFKNFSKGIDIIINPASFTENEINSILFENRTVIHREEGVFFPVKNIPEGSKVLYSVNNSEERSETYNLTTAGETYTIHAYIIKKNYNEHHVQFTINVIDATFEMEGFEENEEVRHTKVAATTTSFNLDETITKSEDVNFAVYSDLDEFGNPINQIDSTNLTINEGLNTFYMVLSVYGTPTTQVYVIEIYRYKVYQIEFYFKDELIEKTTFNEEDGTINAPQISYDGYKILGWETGGYGVDFPYVPKEDTTFNAVFELIDYEINLNLGGGTFNVEVPKSYTVESEGIVIDATPTKKGHNFLGWKGENDELLSKIEIAAGSIGNKHFTAVWEVVEYEISYNLNGGTINEAELYEKYSIEDEVRITTQPTKTGYKFVGWSGTDITKPVKEIVIEKGSVGNRAYTANWEIVNYSIKINLGGGAFSESVPNTYTVESETIVIAQVPTFNGYTFLGFKEKGTENVVQEITIENGSTGNKEFSAVWEIINYTINFELNGGTLEDTLVNNYNVESENIKITYVPTKLGYTFLGWQGTGITYPTKEFTIVKGSTGNRSYEAVWEINTYTLSFNLNGGSAEGFTFKQSYTVEDEIVVNCNLTLKGHTFLGWSGTDLTGNVMQFTISKGSVGNRSYEANFKINTYTYTFYNENNEIIKQETINYGAAIVKPETPLKNSIDGVNYWFNGWGKEVPEVISDEDLTFKAEFREEIFSKGLNFVEDSKTNKLVVDKGTTTDENIIVPSTFNHKIVFKVAVEGFANMPNVKTIEFNENIVSIGSSAFANSENLTSVTNLSNITAIPAGSFENCVKLTNFEIGNKVIVIGEKAFKGTALSNVNISESVVAIEELAFNGCPVVNYVVHADNANYASLNGNLYNKNLTILIKYAVGKNNETFIIPGYVKEIKQEAFIREVDNEARIDFKLKNLVVPTSVLVIGANTIDVNIVIYTYHQEEPELWDASIFANNTVYWNGGWDFVNGVPHNTLEVSAFKTDIYSNWMSYIKDDVRFLDVVMPGSHDAGTNGLGALYKTQNSGFYDQLIGGVRYFDTRVAEFNGNVRCVHADSGNALNNSNATGVLFKDLLNDLMRFINENPSEVIVLDFQHIWSDFNSIVLPMLKENIPEHYMLKKSQASSLQNLTMGNLRSWGVNVIVFVNSTSGDKPNFEENDILFERGLNLVSPYERENHTNGGDRLVSSFASYLSQNNGESLFVLQSQRTGSGLNFNIQSLEKDFRDQANRYLRTLALNANLEYLNKINVVMRDFVVDEIDTVGAIETIQSILFLNHVKGSIKLSRDYYFEVKLDYANILSKVEAENPPVENVPAEGN